MKRLLLLILLALAHTGSGLIGQILSISPVFPKENDTITIIYHADQGNGELTGISPVYAHTGVITNQSPTATSWRHVVGNWGTPDPTVLMQQVGVDSHMIQYQIRNFYNVPGGETVEQLAFVFRNADGSKVGRMADGSDIFTPVYNSSGGLFTTYVKPFGSNFIQSIGDTIKVDAWASDSSALTLTDNGTTIASTSGENLLHDLVVTSPGNHQVIFTADNGSQISRDTFNYVVNPSANIQAQPANTLNGINYLNDSTVLLSLFAPQKDFVYVIGDFNNWNLDVSYFMNKTPDQNTYWLEITGLTPGQDYAFQYYVDGELRIADPYSELVLDPNNDGFISPQTYPNLPAYPTGKTTGIATVITPGAQPYAWNTTGFTPPKETDLVVYELLVRDFVAAHDYQTILDTLDYLQRLGINAIQFMPVNEFEGNESWGYNPSFHMALDKYYGPKNDFKALIDECHNRGIAVILDVVYNHAFSQSPLCQLYWDDANFQPAPGNPWLNPTARHPFNVGYDFNHESQATKNWMDQCLTYWLNEYKVDGFRFDLSKGFTQTNSGNDVGFWGQYDQSRVNLLQRLYDTLKGVNPNTYVILEHFSDNSEEKVLADYGMMFWGNLNHPYNEASMGWISQSNFNWIDYQQRGWNDPKVVGYMESHDEQRLMYKTLQFGNSSGSYNTQNLTTALARMELVSSFFYTVPGPKMIWQFGEVGYDVDIDDPCRVCNKPILWNYYNEAARQRLYKVNKALTFLKTYPVFETTNWGMDVGGTTKTIHLDDGAMKVAVLGNFGVTANDITPWFQQTGKWYEYFTGDSINVSNVQDPINLQPGEYRIYTTQRLPVPDLSVMVGTPEELGSAPALSLEIYPNPSAGAATVNYEMPYAGHAEVEVFNLMGGRIATLASGFRNMGSHRVQLNDLEGGVYFVRVTTETETAVQRLVVTK